MNTIFSLIENKADYWIKEEKQKSQSVIGNLIKNIEKRGRLREPQKKAIEVYLWLKFVGQNKKLSQIIKEGLLYDEVRAKSYDNFYTFGDSYITHFLNQFFQDNGLKNLTRQLANDPNSEKIKWEFFLENLLHNYDYPNYLFSLPMGAGKTYLIACFIYLDLYFGSLYKRDKRFAHNFIVLAPQSAKTAILPSLQTIKNFDPEWILPKKDAEKIQQIIQIEILDALSSKRKDKLQGNNPNLEKVNRLTQTKDFGLVFITNAEKVVLEKYDDKDKIYIDPKSLLYDEKIVSEIKKSNDLRKKLAEILYLGVMLDEVHHSYGTRSKNKAEEKRLRQTVNLLNENNNVVGVLGFSGTPYVRHSVAIDGETIKLNQIQDIVYDYALNEGVGRFLKIPEIISDNVAEKSFVKKALDTFFKDFDKTYKDGTKSKIAFYCPSIKKLNEDILPVVQEWYKAKRKGKDDEIFRYYSYVKKDNKEYALPKDSLAIFNNLDKPYSDKRVILLVAVGTEGWDCKSLTAVALPRRASSSKNFVLQTTCRCLREVDDASKEKAFVYLSKENYKKLDEELGENYKLKINDLKFEATPAIPVRIRKPKLGKLQYNQVIKKYKLISKETKDQKQKLKDFDFNIFKKLYPYRGITIKAGLGRAGLIAILKHTKGDENITIDEIVDYDFNDFIYDLSKELFGRVSAPELIEGYKKELQDIFKTIEKQKAWIFVNPSLELKHILQYIASFFADEFEYKTEIITQKTEIELLQWNTTTPEMNLYKTSGALNRFMPQFDEKDARLYIKHPEDLEEDFFSKKRNIDPQNISFNYIPYQMDSNFEVNALKEMLISPELKNLEVYFNGYKNEKLQSFYIQTPRGVYTPDFLILKRRGKMIDKILIIETKGNPYYDDEFRAKEVFVKDEFVKHNPQFKYVNYVDMKGKNDFSEFIIDLKEKIKTL